MKKHAAAAVLLLLTPVGAAVLAQGATSSQTPVPPPGARTSPTCLIVDLDDNGLSLSTPEEGVLFDADADGTPERIGWPKFGSQDVLLALDTNGNGKIDSGAELLGNAMTHPLIPRKSSGISVVVLLQGGAFSADGTRLTPPPAGKSPMLEPDDAIFTKVRAWRDSDHNGRSAASELLPLADLKIIGVGAGAQIIHRDHSGHLLKYKSYVLLHGDASHDMFEVVLARR